MLQMPVAPCRRSHVSETPRCRPLPPSIIEVRAAVEAAARADEVELLERLTEALHELPPAERTAVIASFAYGEGVVGAAIELDVETPEAHRLGQLGLHHLRDAMRDPG
jgi:DNA-directed RNA polymerase specialized sigma24 family protein